MADGKTLQSRRAFDGRMLKLDIDTVELPNQMTVDLEIVRHPGAAAVVPIDSDHNVILVRQYRYTIGEWLLEIPAGKLDSRDEDPGVCARRELLEETGYTARTMVPLGSIWVSPGFTDERISLYLARELEAGDQHLEDDEVLEVERLPLSEAVTRAYDGSITDAKSATALMRTAKLLGL